MKSALHKAVGLRGNQCRMMIPAAVNSEARAMIQFSQ